MQKWEYKRLDVMSDGDRREFRGLIGIGEILNSLGTQGWELVASDNQTFVFKRPLPPPQP